MSTRDACVVMHFCVWQERNEQTFLLYMFRILSHLLNFFQRLSGHKSDILLARLHNLETIDIHISAMPRGRNSYRSTSPTGSTDPSVDTDTFERRRGRAIEREGSLARSVSLLSDESESDAEFRYTFFLSLSQFLRPLDLFSQRETDISVTEALTRDGFRVQIDIPRDWYSQRRTFSRRSTADSMTEAFYDVFRSATRNRVRLLRRDTEMSHFSSDSSECSELDSQCHRCRRTWEDLNDREALRRRTTLSPQAQEPNRAEDADQLPEDPEPAVSITIHTDEDNVGTRNANAQTSQLPEDSEPAVSITISTDEDNGGTEGASAQLAQPPSSNTTTSGVVTQKPDVGLSGSMA